MEGGGVQCKSPGIKGDDGLGGYHATLGFKLFVAGSAIPVLLKAGMLERTGIMILGTASALFLLWSLRDVVDIKIHPQRIWPWLKLWVPLTMHAVPVDLSGQPSSACEALNPSEHERSLVQGMEESELLVYLTQKVDVAVSELRQRNSTRKWRVESAERRFLFAILFLLFAAAWHVWVVVRIEKEHANDAIKLLHADQQAIVPTGVGRTRR